MSAMDWASEKSSSGGFSTVRHIKEEAAKLGVDIEAKAAVMGEKPERRRGL